MPEPLDSVVLLINCKDRKGIVARVAGFIHDFGGNILDSDHHTDRETGDLLMRTEFESTGLQIPVEEIVLARAVRLHVEQRVLVYGNKTVVFD